MLLFFYCVSSQESLSAAVSNNISLAQQTFENEKRDFLRFLNQIDPKIQHPNAPNGDPNGNAGSLMGELRKFIRLWLKIYSEAVQEEKSQDLLDQLDHCQDIEELLEKARAILTNFRCISTPNISMALNQELLSLQSLEPPNFKKPCCLVCPGLRCTARCRCVCDEENLQCGLCRCELLDSSHGLLLIALAVSWLLMLILLIMYFFSERSTHLAWEAAWDAAPLVLYTMCLSLVLCRYERVCAMGRQQSQWKLAQHHAFSEVCADSSTA